MELFPFPDRSSPPMESVCRRTVLYLLAFDFTLAQVNQVAEVALLFHFVWSDYLGVHTSNWIMELRKILRLPLFTN